MDGTLRPLCISADLRRSKAGRFSCCAGVENRHKESARYSMMFCPQDHHANEWDQSESKHTLGPTWYTSMAANNNNNNNKKNQANKAKNANDANQRQPATTNANQCQPTPTNANQRQPAPTNANQRQLQDPELWKAQMICLYMFCAVVLRIAVPNRGGQVRSEPVP